MIFKDLIKLNMIISILIINIETRSWFLLRSGNYDNYNAYALLCSQNYIQPQKPLCVLNYQNRWYGYKYQWRREGKG